MCKAILMMLLAVVSSNAMAEWVKVGGSDTLSIYADPTTIRKKSNIVKMWNMFDLKAEQTVTGGKPFLSVKGQEEYDCKEEQVRILYESNHSRNMGSGEQVFSTANLGKWLPVPPDSGTKVLWNYACGKR